MDTPCPGTWSTKLLSTIGAAIDMLVNAKAEALFQQQDGSTLQHIHAEQKPKKSGTPLMNS